MYAKTLSALAALTILASPVTAKTFCKPATGEKWLTMSDIRKKVSAAGYKNFRIGLEYGCYEAEGEHKGEDLEVYLHPVTGKIVKVRKDED